MLIGVGVGVLYGAFGAGGSAFATPLLALAGVPAVIAVASPLPATIPAALLGAWSQRDHVARRLAGRCIVAGLPATVLGALASGLVPGPVLLALSAVSLLAIGVRLLDRRTPAAREGDHRVLVGCVLVGFSAGLLANSGGFLLVPLFLLVAGLGMRAASGTSLAVAAALTVPTLLTHWALGHVDWRIAILVGIGLLPGTVAGTRLARHLPPATTQRAFGVVLVLFASWYLTRV